MPAVQVVYWDYVNRRRPIIVSTVPGAAEVPSYPMPSGIAGSPCLQESNIEGWSSRLWIG